MSATIESSVEIGVPARHAYDQWTQFEDLPGILPDVEKVEQVDDTHLRWSARVAGSRREGVVRICEQIPDKRIAWTSESGLRNAGAVTFHRLADDRSKVMLQLEYEPVGVLEKVGDLVGLTRRQVEADLLRFKSFLEQRGAPTGAWRGSVSEGGAVEREDPSAGAGS